MTGGASSSQPERDQPERGQRRRAAAVLLGAAAFVAVLLVVLIRLLVARPAPVALAPSSPAGPPLTRHLALIIVDGLRVDVASDPARMPEFSRLLRERTSGEIWSSPVSMTSAAILTYATGQRGDIDQIVNNEAGSAVAYNSLLGNAKAAGLTVAGTGDRIWFRYFPGVWSMSHPDPAGVAIEVDYNDEIFQATYEFLRATPRPDLLIAHFVTPDHQAHAYGVLSERYTHHIRGFDGRLRELLDAIPPDTTVFVTSDHGATDTGTHGSDTPLQRRSPLVAYGPGVVQGRVEARPLDQIDLPGTFAALLGVAAPAHSRGHVLADWLDAPDERRAAIACAELDRLVRYAATALPAEAIATSGAATACADPAPRVRIDAAAGAARALDRGLDRVGFSGSDLGWLAPAFAIVGALGLALLSVGRPAAASPALTASAAALALLALASGVLSAWGLELLPGHLPDPVRGALFGIANLALLAATLRPRAAAALLDRRVALGAALVPGLLLVSYTKTTQPEAFALALVIGAFAMSVGLPRAAPGGSARPWLSSAPRLAFAGALVLMLLPVAYRTTDFLPSALRSSEARLFAAACAAIAVLTLDRYLDARARPPAAPAGGSHPARAAVALPLVAGAVVVVLSLLLRRLAPPALCLAAWLSLPIAAALAWRSGRRALAELLALGSYAWVARDAEVPILVATYLVASSVGRALGRDLDREPAGPAVRPSLVIFIVTFLFGWTYIQRIGIQLGLDFTQLDWGAGAFREAGVSPLRIGVALVYKHAFARAAVLYAVLPALSPAYRRWAAQGLLLAELLRAATLVAMLYFCRHSFWTVLRVLGDIPHAMLAVVVAAVACYAAVAAARPEAQAHSTTSPAEQIA